MKSFRFWIRQFLDEESPWGDLARTVKADKRFPKANEYDVVYDYLESNMLIPDYCLKTFYIIWEEYELEKVLQSN